jgi:hypothetical protein
MVRPDPSLTQSSRQLVRDPFYEPPRIHKDERRPVRPDLRDYAVVDLRPDFLRRDRAKLLVGNFYGKVEISPMADIHDLTVRLIRR